MGIKQDTLHEHKKSDDYAPSPVGSHVLTPQQAKAFKRMQAAPPKPPTEAERRAVLMFRATVKR